MEPLDLKDIHLPEPIGWWPPAPGWWLVPLSLALSVVVVYSLYRRVTRKTVRKSALKLLDELRKQPVQDQMLALSGLSAWLRRVAIGLDGRSQVASLHGEAWLAYLDRGLADAPFSQGAGRCFADAHYRPVPQDVDIDALFVLCERWLKQQGKKAC